MIAQDLKQAVRSLRLSPGFSLLAIAMIALGVAANTANFAGLTVARQLLGLLRSFATRVTPRAGEIQIDGVVLAFAVLTCALVGLAPAAAPLIRLPNGPTLADHVRQGNSGAMGGKLEVPIRRSFVFVQVAVREHATRRIAARLL